MANIQFDTNKKVTTDLPIIPIKEYNNFVVGEIISVEVTEKVSEAKTNYQYKGMNIPNIVIKFKQKIDAYNKDDRFAYQVFKPVTTVRNDGQKVADDTFTSIVMGQFDHLKHILDSFEGMANYEGLKDISGIDSEAAPEELLKQFKAFYQVFVKAFAGKDGKGVYNGIELVAKFIINKGEKRLNFPNFVNKGYIQIAKFDKAGKLITNLAFYGETIVAPKVEINNAMPGGMPAPAAAVSDLNLNDVI